MRIASPVAVADAIARTLGTLDLEAVRATYQAQNEFLLLERFFPDSVIAPMVEEVDRVRPAINRNCARYTVLVGLVERSTARLVCQLYKGDRSRPVREISVRTDPGTLVLFNGDTLWHAITPLGEGEERVSLTLEYVTDPGMTPVKRFISNMKDAVR